MIQGGSLSPLGRHASPVLAAVVWTMNGTVPTMVKSINVRSVARVATGIYRITFESPLPDTNYFVVGRGTNTGPTVLGPSRQTTGSNNRFTTADIDVTCNNATAALELVGVGAVIIMRAW